MGDRSRPQSHTDPTTHACVLVTLIKDDYTIGDKIPHSHCIQFRAPHKFHYFNTKNVLCPKILLF